MFKLMLAVPLAALGGCDALPGQWKGWVYPNGADLTEDAPLGSFETLDDCRVAAKRVINFLPKQDEDGEEVRPAYECGFKCKADSGLGSLNVCEKTEK